MPWISNHKHKIEEKSTKSSRSSHKVVGLGLADLWEFPTLDILLTNWPLLSPHDNSSVDDKKPIAKPMFINLQRSDLAWYDQGIGR